MTPMAPIAWREVTRWALVGAALVALAALLQVQYDGGNPVSLVQPGARGPSVAVFEADFPELDLPDSVGLDGQQFYAIARDPVHLDETSEHLDRPRYRLQRPLLSWLAWAVNPWGPGLPLVAALFVVGVLAAFLLGIAAGGLSMHLGGPAWVAAAVTILPGTYWSLRVTVADALAVGLALSALLLHWRLRQRWALIAGAAALLARETSVLVLGAEWLRQRDRRSFALVAVPVAVVAAWWLWLRLALPGSESNATELERPFAGIVGAVRLWLEPDELQGMFATVLGLSLAAFALWRRGVRHPLGVAIAVQLAAAVFYDQNVLGNDFGGTRSMLAVTALSIICLATPQGRAVENSAVAAQGAAGRSGPGSAAGGSANR